MLHETMNKLTKEREAMGEMMREIKEREEQARKQIAAEREEIER